MFQVKCTIYFSSFQTDKLDNTIYRKVPNFRMPENFVVIYLKFKKRGQTLWYFVQKDANGIANSEDPDQTAPLGAV